MIGIGFMGSMHAAIFARELRAELVAVVDKNFDLARSVAARFPGTKAYASQDKLIAAERLDLVSICTHEPLHLEPALAIAEKGINLFIEKPIASRLEEGEAIVAAVRKAGVKLGIGHLLRFDPRYSAARELICSGKIGDPIHVYARRNSARTEGPKRYVGTLSLALHVTVHDVDLVLWMLEGQEPVTVYAQQTDKLLGPIGTQDTIAALVRFSGGTLVNFESAWSIPGGARHLSTPAWNCWAPKDPSRCNAAIAVSISPTIGLPVRSTPSTGRATATRLAATCDCSSPASSTGSTAAARRWRRERMHCVRSP